MKISQADLDTMILAHNAWLANPALGRRLIIHNLDLSEAIFDGRNLTDAEFDGCYLHRASFKNAVLVNATFTHNLCTETLFNSAALDGANLTDTVFWKADLRLATKVGATELRTAYKSVLI